MPLDTCGICVGDTIRIRDWDDMKAEFGENFGDIAVTGNTLFVRQMQKFCGQEFTVRGFYTDASEPVCIDFEGREDWRFTPEMCEIVPNLVKFDPLEFDKLLGF